MPHWRHMMSSDKLHAADLMGKEHTVVIEKVLQGEYPDLEDPKKKLLKPDLYFKGKKKPLGLNSTNARTITKLLGSPKTEDWVGKAITLYPTTTRAFGEEHECIRIKNRLPDAKSTQQAQQATAPTEPPASSSATPPTDEANPRLTDAEKRALELAEAQEAGR